LAGGLLYQALPRLSISLSLQQKKQTRLLLADHRIRAVSR